MADGQACGSVQDRGIHHQSRRGKYVGLAAVAGQDEPEDNENSEPQSLDYGITAYHLRILCESEWQGGCGYTPEEVSSLTPDQVYFRLCDAKLLARKPGKRIAKADQFASWALMDKDGTIKGRDEHGNRIQRPLAAHGGLTYVAWLKKQKAEHNGT